MFDNLKNISRYLDDDKFSEMFNIEWERVRTSFIKYEARQEYDEEFYQIYLKTSKAEIIEKLADWRLSDKSDYDALVGKGVKLTRLRPVIFPLTNYLEFEYYCYLFNSKMGENIFYIDITNRETHFLDRFSDFVLFDNKAIFIHDYDEKGVLRGAWYLKDYPEIDKVVGYYNELLKISKPFNDMFSLDSESQRRVDKVLDF